MNLRHIDPRSTDWMDAMLEGEPQNRRKRDAEEDTAEETGSLMAAQAATSPPEVREPGPDRRG